MKITVRNFILNIIYSIFCLVNKQSNLVLYKGSGKADVFENISIISDYLNSEKIPHIITDRPRRTLDFMLLLWNISKAKILIYDSQNPCAFIRKKKTIFINCWHAAGAYKTLAYDAIIDKENEEKEKRRVKRVYSGVDYWICSSELQADIYSNATKIDRSKFIPIGIPRTDRIERRNEDKIKKSITVLYAPTFRGRKKRYIPGPFNIDEAEKYFDRKVCFAYRGHPTTYSNNSMHGWLDLSNKKYSEALNSVDLVITDYSSIIFDCYLGNKPYLLYTPDIDEYTLNDHSLYFMPKELGKNIVCKDVDDIFYKINLYIKNELDIQYYEINDRLVNRCNGNSTYNLINFIRRL